MEDPSQNFETEGTELGKRPHGTIIDDIIDDGISDIWDEDPEDPTEIIPDDERPTERMPELPMPGLDIHEPEIDDEEPTVIIPPDTKIPNLPGRQPVVWRLPTGEA